MFKADFKPNRFTCCVNAVKKLIKERLDLDSSSAFAIIEFSNSAKKLTGFTNIENSLIEPLNSLSVGDKSALGDALALSIKIVIDELRKIMAKVPKILVFSDGNYTKTAVDPLKMARLAQGLSIKIDTFRIGDVSQLNVLKRLSDTTGGTYYYSNDPNSLLDSAHKYADSNIKIASAKSNKLIKSPQFLRKIAANLLRVEDLTESMEMRIKHLRGEADYKKCTICFSEQDPYTKGSFYLTGRYCPNCKAPFHIHCLSQWASSQSDQVLTDSGTCRCPHCFYLIKIPTEVSQAQKLKTLTTYTSTSQNKAQKPEIIPAELVTTDDLGEIALYKSCPVCNFIFEENQEIVRCPNCDTLYHVSCFKELIDSHCKVCGKKLHLY